MTQALPSKELIDQIGQHMVNQVTAEAWSKLRFGFTILDDHVSEGILTEEFADGRSAEVDDDGLLFHYLHRLLDEQVGKGQPPWSSAVVTVSRDSPKSSPKIDLSFTYPE